MGYVEVEESDIRSYFPITGSYIIVECNNKFLFEYNIWRKQWELPSGGIEIGENPRECAARELLEETNQLVDLHALIFKGLVKIYSENKNATKFRAVYYVNLECIAPFIKNSEVSDIALWDVPEETGTLDLVDFHILRHYTGR